MLSQLGAIEAQIFEEIDHFLGRFRSEAQNKGQKWIKAHFRIQMVLERKLEDGKMLERLLSVYFSALDP